MAVAESLMDVREATGRNDGYAVEYMLNRVDMPAGLSWCGAFIYTVMDAAGVELPGRPAAYAWAATWTASHVIWRNDHRRTRAGVEREQTARASGIVPGDVFGIYYSSVGRVAHVGIVKDWGVPSEQYALTVEGNTGSGDALTREGDGVYCKRRLKSQIYAVSRWTKC